MRRGPHLSSVGGRGPFLTTETRTAVEHVTEATNPSGLGGSPRRIAVPEPHVDDRLPDMKVEVTEEVSDVVGYGGPIGIEEPHFSQLYLQARLGIHMHLVGGVFGLGSEPHDLCIVLHRAGRESGELDARVGRGDPTVRIAEGRRYRQKQSVFVLVRQPSKDGERIVSRRVRSLVRLKPLDECQFIPRDAADGTAPLTLEPSLVVVDREPCLIACGCDQFMDKVVQGIPDVLDSVPHGEREGARRLLSDDGVEDVLNRLARSRCFLGPEPERFGVAFEKGFGLTADRFDVFVGPVKPQIDVREIGRRGDGAS